MPTAKSTATDMGTGKGNRNMNPFFSIIVPVYKVEPFIIRCIQSVLSQTFESFELILVDDGSPDKSGHICDEFAIEDKRIKSIHTKNGGVSFARNIGINNAVGKWLIFLDADDCLFGNKALKEMYENITSVEADIYQFQILCKYKDFQEITSIKCGFYTLTGLEYMKLKPKRGQASNYVFKKNIISKNGVYFPVGVRISEDQAFTYSYMCYCDTIKICNVLLYVYNVNENPHNSNSVSDEKRFQDAIGHINATRQIIYHLKKCNKNKSLINERIAMMILYLINLSIHLSSDEKIKVHKYFKNFIPFKIKYLFNNKCIFVLLLYLNMSLACSLMNMYLSFK